MNEDERKELYKRALTDWGVRPQVMMVMEETGEMLNALAKNVKDGKEEELDLKFDMKYSDKMVLREADGTVIKIFEFE